MRKRILKRTTYLSTKAQGATDDLSRRESLYISGLTLDVKARRGAFTLIELLVVIAIIAILAAILLPVLDKAKQRSQAAYCLNNMKQLQLCYTMYVSDNNDFLPLNDTTPTFTTNSWIQGNAYSDVTPDNIKAGVLYQYNQQLKIYACPANTYLVGPVTPTEAIAAKAEGYTWITINGYVPETRTCAIDYALGGTGPLNTEGSSPGLNGVVTLAKFSQIQLSCSGGVAGMIVFVDMNGPECGGGAFGIWPVNDSDTPNPPTWWNLPCDRHGNTCTFSFADGHVELWAWHGSAIVADNALSPATLQSGVTLPADPPGTSDDLPRVRAGTIR